MFNLEIFQLNLLHHLSYVMTIVLILKECFSNVQCIHHMDMVKILEYEYLKRLTVITVGEGSHLQTLYIILYLCKNVITNLSLDLSLENKDYIG